MNVLIINASPRLEGNSSFIAGKLFEKYKSEGAELVELAKLHMKSCTACRACKKNNSMCVIKDDMASIYPKLLAADKIIFISPNHFGFLSSLGKIFTDRWYCLKTAGRSSKFEEGKKAVMIFVQGALSRDMAENALSWGKHFFTGYGLKFLPLAVPGCSADNVETAGMKIEEIKMNTAIF